MKVTFLACLSGPEHTYMPGDVADIDKDEASRLISAGTCVAASVAKGKPKVEKAAARVKAED
jgi:hypothetical protein